MRRNNETSLSSFETNNEIPYEKIDFEIRNLVRLVNCFEGITTNGSCAGHSEGEEAEITFYSQSQESVFNLIRALPFWGVKGGFVNNRAQTQIIWMDVTPVENNKLVYCLRIGGSPLYAQRALLCEIENSLSKKVTHLQETHLSCPKCALPCTQDI